MQRGFGLLLLAILLLVASFASRAQTPRPDFSFFYGNWDVSWEKPEGTVTARVSFDDHGPSTIRWDERSYDEFGKLDVHGESMTGSAAGKRLSLSAGGNVAGGTWDGHPTLWRRAFERIDRIEVEPGEGHTLDYAHMRTAWEEAPLVDNLPTITIRLKGSGLPYQANDAKMIRLDDPGFVAPAVVLPRGANGGEMLIVTHIRNPRLGQHRLWLNGHEFQWTLRMRLEGDCTAIGLAADPPSPRFAEKGEIRWSFLPAGCRLAEIDNDTSFGRVRFTAEAPTVVNFDSDDERTESSDFPGSFPYAARQPGVGLVRARFRNLTGELRIAVQPRPPCVAMGLALGQPSVAVDGTIALHLPWFDANGIAQPSPLHAEFSPPECYIDPATPKSVGFSPAGRAEAVGNSKIRGIAVGPVTVTATVGALSASLPLNVTAQPACDRLLFNYVQRLAALGPGSVVGVGYFGGISLIYLRDGAPDGQQFACVRPDGQPLFFALTPNIEVDRMTGAAVLRNNEPARVGVLHATLWGSDTLYPQAGSAPCGKLTVHLPSTLAIGDRKTIIVDHSPIGCALPPGRVEFRLDDARVANVNIDGVVVATAPGSTMLTVRHGDLVAAVPLAVRPPVACTAMTARLEPAKIGSQRITQLTLHYEPQYCVQPDAEVRIDLPWSFHLIGKDRDSWAIRTLSRDSKTFDGQIVVHHGAFRAIAALEYDSADNCRILALHIRPSQISPRDSASLEVISEPGGCRPTADWFFVSDPSIARLIEGPSGLTLLGVSGGTVKVSAVGGAKSNVLKVQAPNCTSMQLEYYPTNVPAGRMAGAELTYAPAGCTKPPGQPQFSSDKPNRVQPVEALVGGTSRSEYRGLADNGLGAVIGRAGGPGPATISVRHGNLSAFAVLTNNSE